MKINTSFITIGLLSLFTIFGLLFIFSQGSVADSSLEDWQKEVEFLNARLEETSQEYRVTASELQDLREQLSLREATLKKLNSVNVERRERLRILNRKIASFLAQGSQE